MKSLFGSILKKPICPRYDFVEIVSQCGYPQEIQVEDLPPFLQHNAETQDFTMLETDDMGFLGTYKVRIVSVTSYPTSSTNPTPRVTTVETSFELMLVHQCELSEVLVWHIDPMTVKMGESPIYLTLPDA